MLRRSSSVKEYVFIGRLVRSQVFGLGLVGPPPRGRAKDLVLHPDSEFHPIWQGAETSCAYGVRLTYKAHMDLFCSPGLALNNKVDE